MAHHKRKRPIKQRAGCFCKIGKKFGGHELRGSGDIGSPSGLRAKNGGLGGRLRLAERAMDVEA